MTVGELVQRLGRKAEGVNMLEIESYLRSSKVCQFILRNNHLDSKHLLADC